MNWQPGKVSTRKSIAVILMGVAFMLVGRAHPQESEPASSKDHPLLEVDLRNLGYKTYEGVERLPTFVDFTDVNNLAVAWLTLDDRTADKKTGKHPIGPAHLHVFALDTRTGQKQGLREWSTPSYPVSFLGVHDGRFLTCTGSLLRLFSPSFDVIRELHLPDDRACESISPSRQLLLLSFRSGQRYQRTLLDVGTFAAVAEWTEEDLTYGISSHWLVGRCGKPLEVCIRRIDQSWHAFQPPGIDKRFRGYWRKSTFFVNDETLVIEAGHEMAVATVDGALLFRVVLPKNRSFGGDQGSSGGERFAVIVNRQRGLTSPGLDMYAFPSNDRVVVYSIPDRRAIYAVKVKGTSPWAPWEPHVNQLALSPDGTLLAVVSDEILKVYRLPGSNIVPALTGYDAPGQH